MGSRVRQGVDLQLQANLDNIQRRNAEARDQTGGSAGQHDLALCTFIFEMFTTGRHFERIVRKPFDESRGSPVLFVDFSWGKEMNPLSETGRLRVDLSLERGGQLLEPRCLVAIFSRWQLT